MVLPHRERLKKAILLLLIALFSVILISFFSRDYLVALYLQKKVKQFNERYQAELKIDQVQLEWIASIRLTGITLKPDVGDTLLTIDTLYLSISEMKLVAGRIAINDLELSKFNLNLVRLGGTDNYSFLFQRNNRALEDDSTDSSLNYAYAADRLVGFIFDKIPGWVHIHDFKLSGTTNGHAVSYQMDYFALESRKFNVPVTITEDSTKQQWIADGFIDKGDRSILVKLFPADTGKVNIPFIGYKWNASIQFDTVAFRFKEEFTNDTLATFDGTVSLKSLRVFHEGIAKRTVNFDDLGVNYHLHIGQNYAELDSSTTITFNQLQISPYIKYQHKPQKQFTLAIHKPPFQAQELFNSIPDGLFSVVEGMKVEGELSFYLDFFVDLSMPDSLRFTCDLQRHHFRVESFGTTDLARFNQPFLYTAYEKGLPVRTFMVGPENPNFRPLDRIPSYLQYAVLTSEDPSFFLHRGFLLDAVRESLILDIKERKFARGGSTISMQLVKNVFLNRQKTIARKLEEALIVWLLENQGLTTKERMYEVYLNIIEWGPLVYGANEAARFYFNKDVAKITLDESIFLASIVPKPKWFKYSFDETGRLKESQYPYFSLVSSKMVSKGWITESEAAKIGPAVQLKGAAKLLLKAGDSIPADSTYTSEE